MLDATDVWTTHSVVCLCWSVTTVSPAKTAEPIEMAIGAIKEPCVRWNVYGRHLANTIGRFVLDGRRCGLSLPLLKLFVNFYTKPNSNGRHVVFIICFDNTDTDIEVSDEDVRNTSVFLLS